MCVWYAPEEMPGGKKLFEQIDRPIHLDNKLLIVLSKQTISSRVEVEIRGARKEEKQKKERKLSQFESAIWKRLKLGSVLIPIQGRISRKKSVNISFLIFPSGLSRAGSNGSLKGFVVTCDERA